MTNPQLLSDPKETKFPAIRIVLPEYFTNNTGKN